MSRQKIEDAEFDDWLQVEEEDTNWLSQQAAQGLPLVLPWKKLGVRLGTCFQSQRLDDPWLKDNPFILSDFYMIPKVLHSEGESLRFPLSSVKGTYDEDVKENKDSEKSSVRANLRCGVVELERNPRLCHAAVAMLKYGGGYKAFTEQYGDYFVWGYRLGGDTGLMISSSAFETKKVEQYGIRFNVEVLFVDMSHTWTKDFHTFSSGKKMRLLGYDTLSGTNWNVTMESLDDIKELSKQAEDVILQSQSLLERSIKTLEDHRLFHGDHLTDVQCELLARSGIIVELVLLPMSAIRDVARWTTERDVI